MLFSTRYTRTSYAHIDLASLAFQNDKKEETCAGYDLLPTTVIGWIDGNDNYCCCECVSINKPHPSHIFPRTFFLFLIDQPTDRWRPTADLPTIFGYSAEDDEANPAELRALSS